MDDRRTGLRTPAEYALAALTVVATAVFAFVLMFVPALVAIWLAVSDW